jgi:hypothetical protein
VISNSGGWLVNVFSLESNWTAVLDATSTSPLLGTPTEFCAVNPLLLAIAASQNCTARVTSTVTYTLPGPTGTAVATTSPMAGAVRFVTDVSLQAPMTRRTSNDAAGSGNQY